MIHYDQNAGRLLALLPAGANELALVAHWLADGLGSDVIKAMPAVLARPFSIETHEGRRQLMPVWFALCRRQAGPLRAVAGAGVDGRRCRVAD